jgi:hypothetical protein
MSIVFCKAVTKKGLRCKNKCCVLNNNLEYCKLHSKIFKFEKPTDCPICQEDLASEKQPLSCGHWVHKNCILNWKDQCPVCRSHIKLTKKEYRILFNRNNRNNRSNRNIRLQDDVNYVNLFDYINIDLDSINTLSTFILYDAFQQLLQNERL